MTRDLILARTRFALVVAVVLFGAAVTTPARQATKQTFSEAQIYFELNDTDGDLGIHASIDGGPWTRMRIEGPGDLRLLDIISRGRLRQQGMTQLFFESAEPSFDDLDPADFFQRFPEGVYEIEARAQDGDTLEGKARLSHVLADRPRNITVNGLPAAESCDSKPLPSVDPPVLIDWDPVTSSHPEIGESGPIKISQYQFFVERAGVKLAVDLPPSITEFEVPQAITALGKEFKYEIIARTSTGNNTAVETCFRVK
jgi:hypothetical protein